MRDVLVRSVFGAIFLLVVFVPYVYDLQYNDNLLTVVFFVFALLGVHELFVMNAQSPFPSGLKLPAMLLTTALFLPLLIQAFSKLIPIRQNVLFHWLMETPLFLYLFGLFVLSLIVFTVLIFRKSSIEFIFKYPVLLSFFYPVLPLWILNFAYLVSPPDTKFVLLIVLLPIYLNDTLAYVSGRLFGTTPLIPSVSPKKTWEGFIGGILGAALVMIAILYFADAFTAQNAFAIALVSVAASFLATLGDLFESKLKRTAGVKDSGKLIPGHGGILDRIDAMLFVTPLLYVLLFFIAK